jgi:hypothetical protein
MKTIIFAGPSISHQQLADLTRADVAPPIRRGDIDRFVDYDVFVILDGEFGQNLSVSPKEILSILKAGKTVIGASSMGALRASELDSCGMIGVGWVYEHFASASIRRDDDVALAYSPVDLSPLTIPIIDIEYWTTLLTEKRVISASEKKIVCRTAHRIFYSDRTERMLMRELERTLGLSRLQYLLAHTSGVIPNIKHLDARLALAFQQSVCGPSIQSERIPSKGEMQWKHQNPAMRTMA